jgi:hypothetical protein
MDSGFDTIGNAVIIAYDRGPVLVTDPWLSDSGYFGSWTQSHEIPEEQRMAIREAQFVWISHGHPDHLDSTTLRELKGKKLLLPDHVGERISSDLRDQGHDVKVLEDRKWYPLSDRVRILCISDYNQDAILLLEINARLLVNTNDASDHGWARFVRKIAKKYDKSFLLALSGRYGEADMMNFLDEAGNRIPPRENTLQLGDRNAMRAEAIGTKAFIPFSSMHRYQRADSVWGNPYRTTLDEYHVGFPDNGIKDFPTYIRYDCTNDTYEKINPPKRPPIVRQPEEFGDFWDETLDPSDVALASEYFRSFEHLSHHMDFINLRVGGKDNMIKVGDRKRHGRGLTFEAPRKSLMTSIKYHFFDDMLIGNFMVTTLHGNWGKLPLYPDFTPYVTKYGDNGLARSDKEIRAYMRAYRQRAVMEYLLAAAERRSEAVFRSLISEDTALYRGVERTYWFFKRNL